MKSYGIFYIKIIAIFVPANNDKWLLPLNLLMLQRTCRHGANEGGGQTGIPASGYALQTACS
jgi:hypothetical protein